MKASEARNVPELHHVPVLAGKHPLVVALLAPEHGCDVAEARDTRCLFHLLHRAEYEPVCVVESRDEAGEKTARVYFVRMDQTQAEPGYDPMVRHWRDFEQLHERVPFHHHLRGKRLQRWLTEVLVHP